MEAQNTQSPHLSFRGPGPQDVEERISINSSFQSGTLLSFIKAAQSGLFPGNRETELPLWPQSELQYFVKKYADWAPSPYAELPQQAGPLGTMPGPSPPAIFRIESILSGMDALMMGALDHLYSSPEQIDASLRAKHIERSSKVLLTRIWYGMSPIPLVHWKAKGLDEEAKIEEALSVLQAVCDVFDYLRRPDIQGSMRDIHNQAFVEFDVFQDACNALRATRGEPMPGWKLSTLWQEYIRCHFDYMEKQARHFVLNHLLTLQTLWKNRLLNTATQGGEGTIRINHLAIFHLNKIQDLYLSVELLIRSRTDGFVMALGVDPRLQNVAGGKNVLNPIYAQIEQERMMVIKTMLNRVMDHRVRERRAAMPVPDFMESFSMVVDREFALKSMQPHIENPPKFEMEPWVRDLTSNKVETFGFLVYRLSYNEDEEEWAKIKERVTKEIQSGWEGIVGGETVKRKAILRWMDGRKVKIEEGDLDGARAHFKSATVPNSPGHIPKGLTIQACLAVTPFSLTSFKSAPNTTKSPNPEDFPGDFRPFIHAIDINYKPEPEPRSTPSLSSAPSREPGKNLPPGYTGSMILPLHLVYPELYALKCSGGMLPMEDLWAVGRMHPWGLYVGPTTGVTRRNWREQRELAGLVVKAVFEGKRGSHSGSGESSELPIR